MGTAKSGVQAAPRWAKAGFKGLAMGGMVGFGTYFESMGVGKSHGQGIAVAKGIGYTLPYVGMAMFAYDVGKMAGDAAYDYQMGKRRSSFTQGFQDPFGNAATMRQRSQHNLNRGRSSLGSEAFLFH